MYLPPPSQFALRFSSYSQGVRAEPFAPAAHEAYQKTCRNHNGAATGHIVSRNPFCRDTGRTGRGAKVLYLSAMSKGRRIAIWLLSVPVYIYRGALSPLKGPSCRHVPSCSSYALEALRLHGPCRGLMLAAGRIARCRPGGTAGFDPVPRFLFRRYRRLYSFTGRWKSSQRLRSFSTRRHRKPRLPLL